MGAVVQMDRVTMGDASPWCAAFDAMEHDGVSCVMMLVYEDEPGDGLMLMAGFAQAYAERDFTLCQVVRVIDGRAYSVDEFDGVSLGPGTAVPTGADLDARAAWVAQGCPPPAASLGELIESFRPGSAPRDRVALVEDACREYDKADQVVEPVVGLAMVLDLSTGPAADLPVQAIAGAVVALSHVEARDGALTWLLPDFMAEDREGREENVITRALSAVVGRDGFHPENLEEQNAMRERLRVLLTMCPRARSSQVAAVVGAYLWQCGDGVMARRVWEAGQDVDPESVILALFLHLLTLGVRCPA